MENSTEINKSKTIDNEVAMFMSCDFFSSLSRLIVTQIIFVTKLLSTERVDYVEGPMKYHALTLICIEALQMCFRGFFSFLPSLASGAQSYALPATCHT